MKSQILGLRVASAIFGLITLAQVARLVIRPEVLVAGHLIPLWPSALAVVILGSMCIWLWKLSTLPAKRERPVQQRLIRTLEYRCAVNL